MLTTAPARWVLACERQWMTAITPVRSESLWGLRKSCVLAMNFEESDRAMAANGTTNALVSPPQGEFQHSYYVVVSLHHGNHGGVVRILVHHSEVVKGLLHYFITRHHLSPTRSVITTPHTCAAGVKWCLCVCMCASVGKRCLAKTFTDVTLNTKQWTFLYLMQDKVVIFTVIQLVPIVGFFAPPISKIPRGIIDCTSTGTAHWGATQGAQGKYSMNTLYLDKQLWMVWLSCKVHPRSCQQSANLMAILVSFCR